jgi:hydrogenase nickel incorporation protein HypA/HybF
VHELSLCQDLLDQVQAIAQTHQAEKVVCITVRIGPLSGVEPKLLASAFSMGCVGTIAEQAELLLETQSIRVMCNVCMLESEATVSNLICRHCGDYDTQLLSGDELILARVELEGVD